MKDVMQIAQEVLEKRGYIVVVAEPYPVLRVGHIITEMDFGMTMKQNEDVRPAHAIVIGETDEADMDEQIRVAGLQPIPSTGALCRYYRAVAE